MSSKSSTTHTDILCFYPNSIVSFMQKFDLGKPWYDSNKVSIIALSLHKILQGSHRFPAEYVHVRLSISGQNIDCFLTKQQAINH